MHRGHSSTYSDSGRSSIDLDMEAERPKKRIRLNLSHMSLEEKIKRRKMKNREAAQRKSFAHCLCIICGNNVFITVARDRKKAKMTDLEAATAAFAEERLKLTAENAAIRKEMLRLRQENERLRQRLDQQTPAVTGASVRPDVKSESVSHAIESAELINASQPQTQAQDAESAKQSGSSQMASPHWTMPFVCLLAVMSNLTTSSSGCKSAQRTCSANRSLMPQIMEQYEKEMRRMGIAASDLSSLSRSWQTSGT